MNDRGNTDLRMAVCTQSVSHFEAPLFNLSAKIPGLQLKVFYLDEVESEPRFDAAYGGKISWGGDLLDGYESERCIDMRAIKAGLEAWGAEVVLMYGYAWPGAARMILSRWMQGKPQIHRGTMNYRTDPRSTFRSRLRRPLSRWLLRRFQAHHFGGSYSRKVLIDAGVRPESLFFVPYSVDSTFFSTGSVLTENINSAKQIREKIGWKSSDRVLLFIAQHNWIKGPDIAMEVFRKYHLQDDTARLLVVGSGSMTDSMKGYAQDHGLQQSVYFAHFVPSKDTIPYYLASDLVLCTSRYETWARMANEAMLCGRPCLINDAVAAAGGLIEDGISGYVMQGLDPVRYVQAIARYFAMGADEKFMMSEAARSAGRKFSYEENINNVVAAARYAVGAVGK